MKVCIITFHFPYNCGAILQCAALQRRLTLSGHDVRVIDYRPWYHQNRYTPLKNPIYYASKCFAPAGEDDTLGKRFSRGLDGFARTVYSWRSYAQNSGKDRKFSSFSRRHLQKTRKYRTMDQLRRSPPPCDVYISGSDQLWNAALLGGRFDPAYFMDFGDENAYRMTYAVGSDLRGLEESGNAPELKRLLQGIDSISLRETRWEETIRGLQASPAGIHIDLDPTLLLDAGDYDLFLADKALVDEPYILTYTMPNASQHKVYNAANLLGEKTGLRVVDVSGNPTKVNEKVKDHRICGPDEFLWYVKNAKYVLTNSFHGTVFSIIFQKTFMTIPHSDTGNRVTELLEKLSLSDRWCATGMDAARLVETPIDYGAPAGRLLALREESLRYLDDCFKKAGEK